MELAQLDIFADSRETMLRNDVLRALEGHDAAGAQQALLVFRGEYPDDAGFEPLQRLTDYASREPGARFSSHADLQHACAEVSHLIEPAARLVLVRLLKRFVAEFDADGTPANLVWFPAWSVVHDNLLGPPLGLAQAGSHSRAERTFRAVLGSAVARNR